MKKINLLFILTMVITIAMSLFTACIDDDKKDEPTPDPTPTVNAGTFSSITVNGTAVADNASTSVTGSTFTLSWSITKGDNNIKSIKIERGTSVVTDNAAVVWDGTSTASQATGAQTTAWTNTITIAATAGTYKITLTDANNNTAIYTFTVSVTVPTTVTDIDGNVYNTVTIGTQVWMAENLKVTKYRDGTPVPNVTDGPTWAALTTGAWCHYNNSATNGTKYGKLYNWYAVTNVHGLAPEGWHIPTEAEWTILENYLIANGGNYDGTTTDNKIAKSLAGTVYWNTDNTAGAIGNDLTKNNSTGFNGLPGGYRSGSSFWDIGNRGSWWYSVQGATAYAWDRTLFYDGSNLGSNGSFKEDGLSVRCVKD